MHLDEMKELKAILNEPSLPGQFADIEKCNNREKWLAAVNEELQFMNKNN